MRDLAWILKFSLKDLQSQKRIYFFLVLNLLIGTFGFLVVQIFQNNLRTDLAQRAQSMMGADFSVSANRQFNADEIKNFEQGLSFEKKTSLIEFFAMLKNGPKSRLVSVRVFDEGYPFYGEIGSELHKLDVNSSRAWVDSELVQMLSIDSSSQLELGFQKIKDIEVISKDSSRFFRGAGFAPVIYFSQRQLSLDQFVTEGSTSKTSLLYQLGDAQKAKEQQIVFNRNVTDNTVKYETAFERAEGGNRTFKYFTDYLGLVAIISISLCFLSGGYLLRWTFQKQRKNIGIYKALGMNDQRIQGIYTTQVFMTSIVSFILSLLLFLILKPALNYYFAISDLPFQLSLTWSSFFISLMIFVVAPLFMFRPMSMAISQLNPKDLFSDQNTSFKATKELYAWYIICIMGFWGLAFYQSSSYKVATLFTVAVFFIIGILRYFLLGLFYVVQKTLAKIQFHWTTTYAIKSVINKKSTVMTVFITFSVSILVLTLLPHIKQSIIEEIRPSNTSQLPRLFLFDVQPSQKNELQSLAQDMLQAQLDFNPLVRARILKLNDADYERAQNEDSITTREQEEEVRFRNRGVNLTYQTELKSSEMIIKGTWKSQKHDGHSVPEISLEDRYAARIGAKIGDVMLFDVQGLEMTGKVTSIRSVRWTSFSPNFFILFQDGVLNEAPQNFLTALSTDQDYQEFQKVVMEKFPNISIIDVRQTVQDVMKFIDQMSVALQTIAIISVVLGFFIFIVLVNTQIQERLPEFNLLKVMGAETQVIRRIIFIQFLFITTLSLLTGVGLGLVLTRILVSEIFSISTSFDFQSVAVLAALLIPIVVFIVARAIRFLDRLSPIDLIRS